MEEHGLWRLMLVIEKKKREISEYMHQICYKIAEKMLGSLYSSILFVTADEIIYLYKCQILPKMEYFFFPAIFFCEEETV